MSVASSQPTYAQTAGSVKSEPITLNEKLTMKDSITNIKDVGIIKNKAITNELDEFYKVIMVANLKCVKFVDNSGPVIDFIKEYFETYQNIVYKVKTVKPEEPGNCIVFSNYNETKGFNNIFKPNYELIDYNFNVDVETENFVEDKGTVTTIEKLIDGTCIVCVIKNGSIGIRTTRTFDASGKYDSSKSHDELFHSICKDKNIELANFIEYSKETPEISYCLHFGLQLNHTPFPKSIDNDIFLLKAFLINDKTDKIDIFNRKISDFEAIKDNAEELEKKKEDVDFIKSELTIDYVKQLDNQDMISLLHNLKCGSISLPDTYSYKSTDKVTDQIQSFAKDQTRDFKGLRVYTDDGKLYEILNLAYSEMSKLRIQYSIEPTEQNDRNLFLQYLHLVLKNNEQEKESIKMFNTEKKI